MAWWRLGFLSLLLDSLLSTNTLLPRRAFSIISLFSRLTLLSAQCSLLSGVVCIARSSNRKHGVHFNIDDLVQIHISEGMVVSPIVYIASSSSSPLAVSSRSSFFISSSLLSAI